MQFLYRDGDGFHFMDLDTFDQFMLTESAVGDAAKFLKDNDELDVMTWQDEPIDLELPTSVTLEVTETDPGLKGDTASGGTKPATLESRPGRQRAALHQYRRDSAGRHSHR